MKAIPLQLGQPAQFARVREFFRRAEFTDAVLCRLLGMEDMSDLGRVPWDKWDACATSGSPETSVTAPVGALDLVPAAELRAGQAASPERTRADGGGSGYCSPTLKWCIEVFVRGIKTDSSQAQDVCGEEIFSTLLDLVLLCPSTKTPGKVFCPVWLYPADGFWVVSDRRDAPDAETYTPPTDVVFPAIYAGTLRFLELLPEARAGDALDLCGGSGIGALHLARTARSAVTADLTERSAYFAEFNARLNGLPVTSLCGDLYAPVSGSQFDLIAAHPPFVPDTGPKMIYRDGGDTGEEIVRRLIEALPGHLRAGGLGVILCVARDTLEQPFEQRVSAWLGSGAREFDVVFGVEKILTVEEVVESMRRRSQAMSVEESGRLLARLRERGTRQFAYGAVYLQRFSQPVDASPLRIRITPRAGAADFLRLLAWRRRRRQPGFAAWLAGSRPRLPAELQLTVRHLVQEGSLVPAEFVFSISNGFESALRPDAWIVPLVARLEGTQSVAEVFEEARSKDELPAGFALADFAGLVQTMVESGLLSVDATEGT